MKKSAILTVLFVIVLAAALGSGWRAFGKTLSLNYENAEKYAAGDAVIKETVKNLDVHWTSGDVTVAYHDKDTVEVAETSKKPLAEGDKLRWWLDGDTLRVQFRKPGLRLGWSLDKQLTITLPQGMKLDSAAIRLTSGDMHIPAIEASDLALKTTSGDIDVAQVGSAETVALGSTSGDIAAALADAASVDAETTSGGIRLTQTGASNELRVNATSGDIDVTVDRAGTAKVTGTSGNIRVAFGAFEDLTVDTTSGSVTAELPAEPGFSGEVSTTSGSVDSAVALEKEGKTYRCGDGSGRVYIHTTSGDVHLQ